MKSSILGPLCGAMLVSAVWGTALGAQTMDRGPVRLVSGHGVNLRSAPTVDSHVRRTLSIGTVVQVVDSVPGPDGDPATDDGWLEISMVGGYYGGGWVHASLTVPLDPKDPARTVRELVQSELAARGERGFSHFVALENGFIRMMDELPRSLLADSALMAPLRAQVEIGRLTAVDAAGAKIVGMRPSDVYIDAWLLSHMDALVYFEIGGSWTLRADARWALHDAHAGTPVGDDIAAWASEPPLGECEADPGCIVGMGMQAVERYLELYPDGRHLEEILGVLQGHLATARLYACDPGWYGDPAQLLGRVRTLVEPIRPSATEGVRAVLEELERGCGADGAA
jgi:hypothetical protein